MVEEKVSPLVDRVTVVAHPQKHQVQDVNPL